MTEKEKLIYCTVRLQCKCRDNSISTGTGFFFNFLKDEKGICLPFIVTNNHVIKDATEIGFCLTICDKNFKSMHQYQQCKILIQDAIIFPHPKGIDLCIISISQTLSELSALGKTPLVTALDNHVILTNDQAQILSPIEDILMVGYPDGIFDSYNNLPVIRKGITATPIYEDYNGKKEFIIDIAAFNGSSGSPVFIFHEGTYSTNDGIVIGNRIALLGILHSGFLHTIIGSTNIKGLQSQSEIPNNLGIIAKSVELLAFEDVLLKKFPKPII